MFGLAKKTPSRKAATKKKIGKTAESTRVVPLQRDVEVLAHQLWVERGRQHGGDAEDWRQAEERLRIQ